MPRTIDDAPSFAGRIVGGLLAFLFAGTTAIAAPWILAWKFLLISAFAVPVLRIFALYGLYLWVTIIAFAAMIIGYLYGLIRTLELFNLIWGTGESADTELIQVAREMRTFIPLTFAVSFLLIMML